MTTPRSPHEPTLRTSTSATRPSARGWCRVLLWLTALGLGVRLLYFAEHAGSAFFDVPILDEVYYDSLARALATGGDAAAINPGFRPLLYPAFLALFYRLAGDGGRVVAIAVQHLLGVATGLLTALLARRLWGRDLAGAVAGGLYLLAGPPLFFEGELLITTLFTCLATAWLVLAGRIGERPAGWLLAGAALALLAQARPNALAVGVAFPLIAAALPASRRRRATLVGWALAGTLLGLAVCGALQATLSGRFQWIAGAGGVNLYLGNKRGADGMIPRQDRPVAYAEPYRDSVEVFAAEAHRQATGRLDAGPGEISRWWTWRTWEEVRADPAAWGALMVRKVSFLIWNREIPNNKSFDFMAAEESAWLAALPVRWWWLVALAPLTLAPPVRRRCRDRRLLGWTVLYVALFAASLVLFFVNARFRIPLWPPLAALAAGGGLALFDAARDGRRRQLVGGLAVAMLGAAASLANPWDLPPPSPARDLFFRSIAHLEKGDLNAAAEDARRSLEHDDREAAAHFQLGTVRLALGAPQAAVHSFERAAALEPGQPRIWNNLGVALERLERTAAAHRAYRRAIELAPGYPPPWTNLALLELRAGRTAAAAERLERAAALGEDGATFHCARAGLEERRGQPAAARRARARAARLDAAVAERCLTDLQRPIELPEAP